MVLFLFCLFLLCFQLQLLLNQNFVFLFFLLPIHQIILLLTECLFATVYICLLFFSCLSAWNVPFLTYMSCVCVCVCVCVHACAGARTNFFFFLIQPHTFSSVFSPLFFLPWFYLFCLSTSLFFLLSFSLLPFFDYISSSIMDFLNFVLRTSRTFEHFQYHVHTSDSHRIILHTFTTLPIY